MRNNISCRHISRVIAITEGSVFNNPAINHAKVEKVMFGARPTYDDMFRFVEVYGGPVNCIANSDVFFNDTLKRIDKMDSRECWALSRWDYVGGKLQHVNRKDSQDAWIFHGKPKTVAGNFHLGIPGCDNRIAYELNKAGFIMRNPSMSVQVIHLHANQERVYLNGGKVNMRVPQPYGFVIPSSL